MVFRAHSKTTFGMSNEKWIAKIGLVKIVLSVFAIFCAGIECIFLLYCEFKGINTPDFYSLPSIGVMLHFESFMFSQLIIGFFLLSANTPSKVWVRVLFITTIISYFYNYNPWISYHQKDVPIVYIGLKYAFLLHPILVPIMILTSLFALWIHWRMRRIEKDYEPCEVIYGGEDSATKILIDKYE